MAVTKDGRVFVRSEEKHSRNVVGKPFFTLVNASETKRIKYWSRRLKWNESIHLSLDIAFKRFVLLLLCVLQSPRPTISTQFTLPLEILFKVINYYFMICFN